MGQMTQPTVSKHWRKKKTKENQVIINQLWNTFSTLLASQVTVTVKGVLGSMISISESLYA